MAASTAKVNYMINGGQLTVNSTVPMPECWYPKYSPDGSKLACSRPDANGDGRLFTMNADGTGFQSLYVASGSGKGISSPDWHYSGETIYFVEHTAGHGVIRKVDLDSSGLPVLVSTVYSNASLDVDSIALAKNLDEMAFAGKNGSSSHIYTMHLFTGTPIQEVPGSFPATPPTTAPSTSQEALKESRSRG